MCSHTHRHSPGYLRTGTAAAPSFPPSTSSSSLLLISTAAASSRSSVEASRGPGEPLGPASALEGASSRACTCRSTADNQAGRQQVVVVGGGSPE